MSISVPVLRTWAEKLERSSKKAEVIKEMMYTTGWSRDKCYRKLSEVGYVAGRKTRSDKRKTEAEKDIILKIAGMLQEGVKKNGKAIMTVSVARSILEDNGFKVKVSTDTLRRILRQMHMDAKSLQRETAYTQLRSLHPNHVHQVDPSLCVMYYSPRGEQKVLHAREMHRNKFEKTAKRLGNKKLWRYVLVDHYSASIMCRYYEADGESQNILWDFLLFAWGRKDMPKYIQHGCPTLLLWDAGSANTSKAVTRALGMLDIEPITHKPGNPRAKGSVERANWIIEQCFESRLSIEPCHTVEELNASVDNFCRRWNNNTWEHYDSSLTRGDKEGLPRTGLWLQILPAQLRELPDMRVCRGLLTHDPVIRKVQGDLSISYKHPRQTHSKIYSLRTIEGVYKECEVEVQPVLMSEDAIRVRVELSDGSYAEHTVEPIVFDVAGFDVTAPVIGESYRAIGKSDVDKARDLVQAHARPNDEKVIFGGEIKSRTILRGGDDGVETHVAGTMIELPQEKIVEETRLSVVEVAKRLKEKYPERWHNHAYEMLKEKYPNGLSESELMREEAIITDLGEDYVNVVQHWKVLSG